MISREIRARILDTAQGMMDGLADIDYDLSIADSIRYDGSVSAYLNYSVMSILVAARATMSCALARKESRGAHYRSDYPQADDALAHATLISFDNGAYRVWLDEEDTYES